VPKNTAPQIPVIAQGATENHSIDCRDVLDSGESLSGTPTIVEVTSTDLTITNKTITSSAVTILGESVPAGKAVQCTITGQLAATRNYTLKLTLATDGSATKIKYVRFTCQNE